MNEWPTCALPLVSSDLASKGDVARVCSKGGVAKGLSLIIAGLKKGCEGDSDGRKVWPCNALLLLLLLLLIPAGDCDADTPA